MRGKHNLDCSIHGGINGLVILSKPSIIMVKIIKVNTYVLFTSKKKKPPKRICFCFDWILPYLSMNIYRKGETGSISAPNPHLNKKLNVICYSNFDESMD